MSFFLTTDQIKNRTKTVTRRLGWKCAKPGMLVQAVKKCQGLKPGEKIEKLAVIRIVSVDREKLYDIMTSAECEREGFPWMKPDQFIKMFCKEMKCEPDAYINRIEFVYVD